MSKARWLNIAVHPWAEGSVVGVASFNNIRHLGDDKVLVSGVLKALIVETLIETLEELTGRRVRLDERV